MSTTPRESHLKSNEFPQPQKLARGVTMTPIYRGPGIFDAKSSGNVRQMFRFAHRSVYPVLLGRSVTKMEVLEERKSELMTSKITGPLYSLRTRALSSLECIAKAELANMSLSYFQCGISDEMRTYDEDAPSSFSRVLVPCSGLERFRLAFYQGFYAS